MCWRTNLNCWLASPTWRVPLSRSRFSANVPRQERETWPVWPTLCWVTSKVRSSVRSCSNLGTTRPASERDHQKRCLSWSFFVGIKSTCVLNCFVCLFLSVRVSDLQSVRRRHLEGEWTIKLLAGTSTSRCVLVCANIDRHKRSTSAQQNHIRRTEAVHVGEVVPSNYIHEVLAFDVVRMRRGIWKKMSGRAHGTHRPGPLKQQNKTHKHGRHRSKGQLNESTKGWLHVMCALYWFMMNLTIGVGRVGMKVLTRQIHHQQRRADKRNKVKLI